MPYISVLLIHTAGLVFLRVLRAFVVRKLLFDPTERLPFAVLW